MWGCVIFALASFRDKVYFNVKILPGAALRSHYHLLSSSAVTVTCMSMLLSDLLFVLVPICSSVSPSVSLRWYFLFVLVSSVCVTLTHAVYIGFLCVILECFMSE